MTLTDHMTRTHTEAPRVLVVDDHRLLGETLQTALRLNGLDVSVSNCASAEAILDEAAELSPRLVVLDFDLAGAGLGSDLVRPLTALGASVLIVSGSTDRPELAKCLEAGALGIVSKAEGFSTVLDGIRRAAEGRPVTPVTVRTELLAELQSHRRSESARLAPFEALSRRERDVLALIVEGKAAADIAQASFVSLATVRTQIRSILQKLDVNTQGAAAALARQAGWTPGEAAR